MITNFAKNGSTMTAAQRVQALAAISPTRRTAYIVNKADATAPNLECSLTDAGGTVVSGSYIAQNLAVDSNVLMIVVGAGQGLLFRFGEAAFLAAIDSIQVVFES